MNSRHQKTKINISSCNDKMEGNSLAKNLDRVTLMHYDNEDGT
jgi:hypothetical protein